MAELNAQGRAVLALVAAGLPASAVELAVKMIDVGDSDDSATIAAKVADVKAALPVLFTPTAGPESAPVPPSGVTSQADPVLGQAAVTLAGGTLPGESEFEAGERWARERFPHLRPVHTQPPGSAA